MLKSIFFVVLLCAVSIFAAESKNILSNGDFSKGMQRWSYTTGAVTKNNEFYASIPKAGKSWDANISYALALKEKTEYRLSFRARSNKERELKAGLGLAHAPWSADTKVFTLTAEWQTFEYIGETSFGSDTKARVLFEFGQQMGDIFIDDVVLAIVPHEKEEPKSSEQAINVSTITFDAQGGAGFMKPITAPMGTALVLTSCAYTKEGYSFDGWRVGADTVAVLADTSTFTPTVPEVTLTARWKKSAHKITYINDGNGVVSGAESVVIGGEVQLSKTPKAGYVFDRYEVVLGTATLVDDRVVGIQSDVTINGVFKKESTLSALAPAGGIMIDWRDGKKYKTVKIGTQVWMAENLNYDSGVGSQCYNEKESFCSVAGRLYTWGAAMNGAPSSERVPSGVQGVCPTGWHIPSLNEWNVLHEYVERVNKKDQAGTTLRMNYGWIEGKVGKDSFGFSALPGGWKNSTAQFEKAGVQAAWHSATEKYGWTIRAVDSVSGIAYGNSDWWYSIRCVQD